MNTITKIPPCCYRVSVKALVLNETRDKFLITKDILVDPNGLWDVPGGGLDWGESHQVGLQRELQEEMGVNVVSVADHPSYFVTHTSDENPSLWIVNVLYETTLENYDFTPSEECTAIDWVGLDNVAEFPLFSIVKKFVTQQFDPARHQHN